MRIINKLPDAEEVKSEFPIDNNLQKLREEHLKAVKQVLSGSSNRFLFVVGPCSADNEQAVLEYVSRLSRLQEKVKDEAVLVPRIYTCKPRTTGDGYKGMLHQPVLSEPENMVAGVRAVRKLHVDIAKETGMFSAEEMLYTEMMSYIEDLLIYTVVGARSVEDQQHRLVSSGMDMPLGMKNPMNGDISVMLNSIQSAQHAHRFVYNNCEVESEGNLYSHAILRGYLDENGLARPNYHYESLLRLYSNYEARNLSNMAVVVDCNHHNSNKQYEEQIRIANEVVDLRNYDERLKKIIKGLMIESYIEDGRQNLDGKVFGKSITDACLGWDKTERLVLSIVEKTSKR